MCETPRVHVCYEKESVVEWKIVMIFHVAPSLLVWRDVFSSCKKDKNELNFFYKDFNFFEREDFNFLCKG